MDFEKRAYPGQRVLTADEYVAYSGTHCDHLMIPEPDKTKFFSGLRDAVLEAGTLVSLKSKTGREYLSGASAASPTLEIVFRGGDKRPVKTCPQGRISCVALSDSCAEIRFDERAASPFYTYFDRPETYEDAVEHVVWFENARSVRDKLLLGAEYGLGGFGVWNVMRYFPALWTLINRMFRIRKYV